MIALMGKKLDYQKQFAPYFMMELWTLDGVAVNQERQDELDAELRVVYLNEKVDPTNVWKGNADKTNERRSKNKQGMLSKRKSSTNKEDQQF
jgi:hypothetical protein